MSEKVRISWADYEPCVTYTLTKDQAFILAGITVKRVTKWTVIKRCKECKDTFDFTLFEMSKHYPNDRFMAKIIAPEYAKEQAKYCILVRTW